MNPHTNTSNFDNLLLQTLMNRLQIRPQNPLQPQLSPILNQTLEDLLFDTINNISDTEEDDDENPTKTHLQIEESKLEKEVIKIILKGESEQTLKPNSGQAVNIGEHHICVGYHVEPGSEYRVWEWHGHVMLFDEENGYNPEYIYGNYFERLRGGVVEKKVKNEVKDDDVDEKVVNFGLKELIGASEESGGSGSGLGRIVRRNVNVGSPSV